MQANDAADGEEFPAVGAADFSQRGERQKQQNRADRQHDAPPNEGQRRQRNQSAKHGGEAPAND